MNLKKIVVNNLEFPSKVKLIEYTRSLLNELGECSISSSHQHYKFFIDLLERHPDYNEKVGCGVKAFKFNRNYCNKKAMETNLIRFDDSIVNYSWISCCNAKSKSEKDLLLRAMRYSVIDQILQFKDKSILECVYCKNKDCEFHVDHIEPFRDLVKTFLEGIEKIPNKFGKDEKYNQTIFLAEDEEFFTTWRNFHLNAKLQILCTNCNLYKH